MPEWTQAEWDQGLSALVKTLKDLDMKLHHTAGEIEKAGAAVTPIPQLKIASELVRTAGTLVAKAAQWVRRCQ